MADYKIYVACLAAYNNGILHGVWMDATMDESDLWLALRQMLKESPIEDAEEWAIHDYDGFPDGIISEYTSFERIHALALFLQEHEKLGEEVLSHFSGDLEDARLAIEEHYMGCYQTLADYAEESTVGCYGEFPDQLMHYMDWEAMARDMLYNGDVYVLQTAYDEEHVFLNH